jgi:hypothetical protein
MFMPEEHDDFLKDIIKTVILYLIELKDDQKVFTF